MTHPTLTTMTTPAAATTDVELETTYTEYATVAYAASVERRLRDAIGATDWETTAVLEVIIARPPVGSFEVVWRYDVVVNRYEDSAPPASQTAVPGRRCTHYRVTKPLLDRLAARSESLTFAR